MVLADSDKDFLSATLCYELSVQIADKIICFAETYSATGTPAFLKQARLGVPTNSPWRIISKEEEQKQEEEHLNDYCLREFAKILKNMIVSRWVGFRSSRYKKVFPFMNIVLCIAIYLSMPVDYSKYHICSQGNYQPAIPNQVCVCRTTSPNSQAKSNDA